MQFPRGAWIALAGVLLIYAGHWFYGALANDTAMSLSMAASLLVLGALASPVLRQDLLRAPGLDVAGLLFGFVIVVALWTLTPWTPGGPHPVWAYVGIAPGASTIDKSATLMETIKLLGLACFFLLGAFAGGRDERAGFAVGLTIAGGIAFALWAVMGALTGSIVQSSPRLEAHFLNANTAGMVFAVLACLAAGACLREWRPGSKGGRKTLALVLLSATLVFVACLLDTASRGAVVAFLVALLVLVALQVAAGRLKVGRALLVGGAAVFILLVATLFAGGLVLDRFFESQSEFAGRLDTWREHWRAFLASPLFGYGLGSAETINKMRLSPQNYASLWSIRGILNVYLQWLEEAGIVGATPMFLTIGYVIFRTLRGYLRRSRMTGVLAGLIAADVVILVHGASDFGLEVFSVAAFWSWLLGLQFSLAQGSSQR